MVKKVFLDKVYCAYLLQQFEQDAVTVHVSSRCKLTHRYLFLIFMSLFLIV